MAQRSGGRRRLQVLLGVLGFAGCAVAMALVLVFYGPPYNQMWWGIMAVVLGASGLLPPLLAPAIEWVIDGYRPAPRA